ncbi:unnamed protein product [Owenia fusiformis]|uniref:U3 small nucleolar RNA-associated protein 18 homolog n=1 Tax=Owenia fusiformis TaxID=6347 RepID=A0A8J1TIX4_OWEFU|nr:unnamed protein product [Owenia fusiformis]
MSGVRRFAVILFPVHVKKMLRKKLKRNVDSTGLRDSKLKQNNVQILGDNTAKDAAVSALEKEVLGGENEILENLDKFSSLSSAQQSKIQKLDDDELVPVWEDEDDQEEESVRVDKQYRFKQIRRGDETKISQKVYTNRLKKQFERVTGTPSWAVLKSHKEARKSADSSDDSDDELSKSTGSYLTGSQSLPKGVLQFKKCPDANKEQFSSGKLKSTEFHPTAQVLLTAGMDQSLHLFQVDGQHNPKIQSMFIENFPIHTAHFTTDGHEVIMGSKHKSFYYFDMIAGKIINVPKIKGLEERNMKKFSVSPDGKHLAFLGTYGSIHLISATSKEWVASLKINGSVDAVCFSPDGSRLYATGDDGDVYVYNMATRDCVHRFKDDGCIQGTSLAVSKNNQYLACGSYSGIVNIYDTNTCCTSAYPTPIKAVTNLTTPCTDLVFNATTEILAMASDYTEKAVKLLHFPSLTVFSNFPERGDDLRIPMCMDFSKNSGYLVVGGHKGRASLYRMNHFGNF